MVPAWAGEHIVRRTVRGSPAKLLRLESGQAPDGCTGRTRHTGRCRALPSPSLQCRRWPRPITPPLHGTLGRLACPSVSFPRSPSRFASECVPGCNVDPSAGGPGDHWARCRSSRTRFLSQHCAIRSKLRSVIWSDSCSSRVSLPPATPPHTSHSQSPYSEPTKAALDLILYILTTAAATFCALLCSDEECEMLGARRLARFDSYFDEV